MRRTLGALLAAVGAAMSALVTLVHGGIALLVIAFAAIAAGLFAFISSAIPKKERNRVLIGLLDYLFEYSLPASSPNYLLFRLADPASIAIDRRRPSLADGGLVQYIYLKQKSLFVGDGSGPDQSCGTTRSAQTGSARIRHWNAKGSTSSSSLASSPRSQRARWPTTTLIPSDLPRTVRRHPLASAGVCCRCYSSSYSPGGGWV